MGSLLFNFLSHDSLFYESFNKASENIRKMAGALQMLVNSQSVQERESLFKQIDDLEHTGDNITHKIFLTLDKVTFTPFNRKSIYALASALDDVADTIKEASGRIHIYQIQECTDAIRQIADYMMQSGLLIERLMNLLPNTRDTEPILALCKQMKEYEYLAGNLYFEAVAELFDTEKDAINVVKQNELLGSFAASLKKCKKVTEVVEIILINNL